MQTEALPERGTFLLGRLPAGEVVLYYSAAFCGSVVGLRAEADGVAADAFTAYTRRDVALAKLARVEASTGREARVVRC